MKSSLEFREQINVLVNWFESWNECEQIVALYTLLRKLTSGHQTKFLLQVLQHNTEACFDTQVLENQANNPAYVKNLCQESKDNAMKQLLVFLPLLKCGNAEAKVEYLKIVPQILTHSIENVCHLEESRHLLSYCLIHPAISKSERQPFQKYVMKLSHIEEQQFGNSTNKENHQPQQQQQKNSNTENNQYLSTIMGDFHAANVQDFNNAAQQQWQNRDSGIGLEQLSSYTSTPTPAPIGGRAITSSSCGGGVLYNSSVLNNNLDGTNRGYGNLTGHSALQQTMSVPVGLAQPLANSNLHKKLARTNSVTHPNSNVSDWLNKHHNEMSKQQTTQMSPLQTTEPHAPLSPQSSVTSSGSDSPQEHDLYTRNTFLEESSGMRDVPIWLKSLRLHKYASLFQQMTYEEMLGLTEEWLESQNVTKGARHKIVLSIQKLKERQSQLRTMEKDIMESCNVKQALQEIKSMMNTPMKIFTSAKDPNQSDDPIAEGDIPGQITRVLGKLCTQLLVTTRPEEDCFAMYLQLLDKCMMHEAWTIEQKKKLASWKLQIQKIWTPAAHRQRKTYANNAYALRNLIQGQRALRGQLQKPVGQPPNWAFTTTQPPNVIPSNIAPATNMPLYRNNSLNTFASRPPLYELQLKQQINRTHSVPITKSNQNIPVPDIGIMEPELAARLDSLCLSMTEHALGNFDSPEKGSTL